MFERWLRDKCCLVDLNSKPWVSRHRVAERGVALNRRLTHQQLRKDLPSQGRSIVLLGVKKLGRVKR